MYSDYKIKFSQSNKCKDKFKPKPGYIRYIICLASNCYNSYYTKKEKAKFNARYFIARKVESIKLTNKTFKAYLAYANQAGQDLEDIRNKIKNRNNADSFNLSASLKCNDANLNLSNKYSDVISYFIAIFIASAIKYNA